MRILNMFEKFFNKKKPTKKGAHEGNKIPRVQKTEKELATERGEPYVAILGLELASDDPGQGAFELDWNDKFVANLIRAGYQGKEDADIVDQWFQNVCRHVVMETWEQEQAQNPNSRERDLGDGYTEVR